MTAQRRWLLVSMMVVVATLMGFRATHAEWWWSVGPVYRGGMEVEFSGRSHVQDLQIQGGRAFVYYPESIGPADAYADRTYENGFVNIDIATAFDGGTWFWGYASDAQYASAGSGSLSFRQDGGGRQTRTVLSSTSMNSSDDMDGWGIGAVAGRNLAEHGNLRVGINFGASALWDMESRKTESTYSEQIGWFGFTAVDTYRLRGMIPPPPPYAGTFAGPGPVMENIPSYRDEVETGRAFWRAENNVALSVNVAMQELWIGPRFETDIVSDATAYFTPFASVNRVEVRAERDEDFTLVYPDGRRETLYRWNDRTTNEEWLLGAGVRAGARVNMRNGWFVDAGAGYEWVDQFQMRIGPNRVKIDFNSYSFHAHLGRAF